MKRLLLGLALSLIAALPAAAAPSETSILVGSYDAGRDVTVRLMTLDGQPITWEQTRGYLTPCEVAPGARSVTLKVRSIDLVCYPVFELNVSRNQIFRFTAKSDGNQFVVSVDVHEDDTWTHGAIVARVRGHPPGTADAGP